MRSQKNQQSHCDSSRWEQVRLPHLVPIHLAEVERRGWMGAVELHFTAAVIFKNTWFTDYFTKAVCVENA